MDSESVGTWKRTLEIQGFLIPAEQVPSAVAIRSAEVDQQNQIIENMAGKMPGKTNEGKRKNRV
jgi:hypothetical protein